jgi:hypothetical protein
MILIPYLWHLYLLHILPGRWITTRKRGQRETIYVLYHQYIFPQELGIYRGGV